MQINKYKRNNRRVIRDRTIIKINQYIPYNAWKFWWGLKKISELIIKKSKKTRVIILRDVDASSERCSIIKYIY